MAAYPNIGLQFDIKPLTGPTPDVAQSGKVRSVDLTSEPAFRITIQHPLATLAQKATLMAFYAANKSNLNTITLGGVDYSFHFEQSYSERSVSATYYDLATSVLANEA